MPYLCLATFVVGHAWRYTRGQLTWTARSIRRITIARIRAATPRSDLVLYPLLVVTMLLGMAAALGENFLWGEYHYRETVSPWFRGVFTFDPDPDLMSGAPFLFQAHAVSAWLLFAVWPFTRSCTPGASRPPISAGAGSSSETGRPAPPSPANGRARAVGERKTDQQFSAAASASAPMPGPRPGPETGRKRSKEAQ